MGKGAKVRNVGLSTLNNYPSALGRSARIKSAKLNCSLKASILIFDVFVSMFLGLKQVGEVYRFRLLHGLQSHYGDMQYSAVESLCPCT